VYSHEDTFDYRPCNCFYAYICHANRVYRSNTAECRRPWFIRHFHRRKCERTISGDRSSNDNSGRSYSNNARTDTAASSRICNDSRRKLQYIAVPVRSKFPGITRWWYSTLTAYDEVIIANTEWQPNQRYITVGRSHKSKIVRFERQPTHRYDTIDRIDELTVVKPTKQPNKRYNAVGITLEFVLCGFISKQY
jgi:hypothetical protein